MEFPQVGSFIDWIGFISRKLDYDLCLLDKLCCFSKWTPHRFLQRTRGIRQGCPLSHYLFLLIIEGLGRLILIYNNKGLIKGVKLTIKSHLTHSLFFDDVMMFGASTLAEWRKIKEYLHDFCQDSGMKVSENKSILLCSGEDDELKREISTMFNFQSKDLNEGNKHLGYFTMPNSYRVVDWRWLVQKFDKRINNWSFRWLSLGGRLIFLKFVLEGILVYWLSLAYILTSIVSTLRQRMFSFLWSGNAARENFHFSKWETTAKPKLWGGWVT